MSSKHAAVRAASASQSRPHAKATIRSSRRSFPSSARLKRKKDFFSVQELSRSSGGKYYSKHFLLLVAPATGGKSRLGITVTLKVDKRAVARNRVKRFVREVFRHHQQKFKSPIDLVVIARQGAPDCSLQEVEREITASLNRGGIL